MPHSATHRLGLQTLALAAVTSPLIMGAWLAVCVRYVARPTVDPIQPVDAVYVLGPPEGRIDTARAAMAQCGAETMVVTVSADELDGAGEGGPASRPYEVLLVTPDPFTTRGESMTLNALVGERGWRKVAVVTDRSHLARARMQMTRCVDAEIVMWQHRETLSLSGWLSRFAYHSGAWVKAQVVRGC